MKSDTATPSELEALAIALAARQQGGVVVVGGQPYIHGVPAKLADAPSMVPGFSNWHCPHCSGRLSDGPKAICLNGCHLTAPQYLEFQSQMRQAEAKVAMKRKWLEDLTPSSDYPRTDKYTTFPADFGDFTSLIRVQLPEEAWNHHERILEYMHETRWRGYVGLGVTISYDYRDLLYGLFVEPTDAVLFKIAWAGAQTD